MKKNEKQNQDAGEDQYLDGAPEFQDTLDDALDEQQERHATDYRRRILLRSKFITQGEWKLRKDSPDKPQGQTKPTTPKTPGTTPSKPRSDHGQAPQAPVGQSYYWAEPSKSNKGGGHE